MYVCKIFRDSGVPTARLCSRLFRSFLFVFCFASRASAFIKRAICCISPNIRAFRIRINKLLNHGTLNHRHSWFFPKGALLLGALSLQRRGGYLHATLAGSIRLNNRPDTMKRGREYNFFFVGKNKPDLRYSLFFPKRHF